jgi:hypothetical protein
MDLIMGRRGTRVEESRLGQGEQENWSKGKMGTSHWVAGSSGKREVAGLGQGEQEDWARESSRTGPGRAAGLGQEEQEDWSRKSGRNGSGGA